MGKVSVMRISPRLTLNNGVLIDRLGFGLEQGLPPADAANLVTMAIEAGYRHFDCRHVRQRDRRRQGHRCPVRI